MLSNLFERRNTVSYQTLFNLGGDSLSTTASGVVMNVDKAFTINAFWSAISLISDSVSTLPFRAYINDDQNQAVVLNPQPLWLRQPDPAMSKVAFLQSYLISVLAHGHGFARVYRHNGEIVGLAVLNPVDVTMVRGADAQIIYRHKNKLVDARDMISVPYFLKPGEIRGTSPVFQLAENLGLAVALETFTARFFGSGASTSMVLKSPKELSKEQTEDLAAQFNSRHSGLYRSHKPLVLQGGLEAEDLTAANDDNQLIESRRFAVEDISRIFNIPPHLLGLPGFNSYASVEEANLQWISHTLRPLATKLEAAFSQLLPENQFLRFNFGALERGNLASRSEAYSKLTQAGVLSTNDARRFEDLQVVEGGDLPRVPLANVNIDAAGLAEMQERVRMAQVLINAGFNPDDTLANLDLPPIKHDGGVPVTLQAEQP